MPAAKRKSAARSKASTSRTTSNPANPWDRIDGEPDKAFEAFRLYLEQGAARSTAKVAQALGHKTRRTCTRWSARWHWVRRVAAFDQQAAATADEAHLDQVALRSKRQAELMQMHGEVMALPAEELQRRLAGEPARHFKGVSDDELFRMAALGARAGRGVVPIERLASGVSTDAPAGPAYTPAQERALRASDEDLDAELAGIDPANVVPISRARKASS